MRANNLLRYARYLIMGLIAALLSTILMQRKKPMGHPRDFAEIETSGVLRATVEYNSLSYFTNGDSLSGFHYELLQIFAQKYHLQVSIKPLMSFEKRLSGLAQGEFDVIAYDLLTTSDLRDTIALTEPLMRNKQVLVQRKRAQGDSTFISNPLELAHHTLNVVKGSPATLRIRNLSNEIGDTIYIQEVEKYGQEQLLAMVAHGDIDYAVCDESLAKASIDSLPQLDISTDIGFTQLCAWGVSKQSPALLDSLNSWIKTYTQTTDYQKLYKKYYND